jgi:hypothetical protein
MFISGRAKRESHNLLGERSVMAVPRTAKDLEITRGLGAIFG